MISIAIFPFRFGISKVHLHLAISFCILNIGMYINLYVVITDFKPLNIFAFRIAFHYMTGKSSI